MIASYDVRLVILSVLIAVIASYTALDLAGRVTATKGQSQKLWLAGGAIAMGTGIWSMHFVGMLAYKLPLLIGYDFPTTVLSLIVAIISSGAALFIVSRKYLGWLTLLAGGIFMGLGIASMHYIGMEAMRMNSIAYYDLKLVVLSIAIAISASLAALWLGFQLRGENSLTGILQKIGSASIMGIAIAGMHYTGLAAVTMQVNNEFTKPESQILGTSSLALAIAIGTVVILSLTLLTSIFDREIQEERRQLAEIVESSNDAIISSTVDGKITSWNSAATRLFGYSVFEAKGSQLAIISPPDRADEVAENYEKLKRGELIDSVETVRVRKDGQQIHISLTISPIKNAAGKITGASAIARDITERKRAQEALEKQAATLKDQAELLNLAHDTITVRDLNNTLTFWNRGAEEMYGWTKEEALGKNPQILLQTEFPQPLSEIESELFHKDFWQGELLHTRKDGTPIIVSSRWALRRDEHRNPLAILEINNDITDRKLAENGLKNLNQQLETKVRERTAQLLKTNEELQLEIAERTQIQIALAATNKELLTSELRFRSLVSNIPGAIYRCLCDANWTMDFISDAIQDITGYPAAGFLNNCIRTYASIIHPDDRETVAQLIQEALDNRHPFILEYRIIHADGSIRWLYEKGQGYMGEDSKAIWLDGAIFDITQRKQAEEKIRENEERFRLLVEGVKDYAIIMLNPDGYIASWNAAAERIKGYKAEEIIGEHFSRFYPQEDVDMGKPEYELEIATAQGTYEEEGWRVRKDGSYFWANVVMSALRDEAGNLRGFSNVTRDITLRKRDEQRLRKWADIFHHTGQGLIITNPGSKILEMMNPALAKMHGYTVEELMGLPMTTIIAPDVLTEALEEIYFSWKKNQHTFETKHIRKNGTIFPVMVDSTNVEDKNGNFIYTIVNVQDITERKQAEIEIRTALEKEKELSELKTRFLTMTSHEFRTPLATILSSAELLEYYSHKLPKDEKQGLFRQIENATKRMTQLLEDILAINKAEAGKVQFKPESLNLEKLCHEIVSEIQLSTGNKHKIVFTNSGNCTSAVMDEKLLRHILLNLLSNAVKYSPKGGIVEFGLTCQNQNATFKVKDFGIGIPIEDQPQLFESFHRASNVGNIPGTGLGLSIVKRMVDLHAGSISVASEIGLGTTFTVTIPLESKGNGT
jgi:PAS domain S-box-containing protein